MPSVPTLLLPTLPLPTLLSRALVAFTIEFDNEFEHRMPHRTTNHGSTSGARQMPWLVSLAMWANCVRFLDDGAMSIAELERLARTKTNLAGMRRWGYVIVDEDSKTVRASEAGWQAAGVWQPLAGVIEQRWRDRFGVAEVERLRAALASVAGQLDGGLPDCMPILGYGLRNAVTMSGRPAGDVAGLPLYALLSRVLVGFAVEFEDAPTRSLAIGADLVRVLDDQDVRVRDLPRLAGVSKEGIAMAMGVLLKRDAVRVVTGQPKIVRLTAKGQQVKDDYRQSLGSVEQRWRSRFDVDELGAALAGLGGESALFSGLTPFPDGWRAAVRRPAVLPHFPMVLHRGGYPDGS